MTDSDTTKFAAANDAIYRMSGKHEVRVSAASRHADPKVNSFMDGVLAGIHEGVEALASSKALQKATGGILLGATVGGGLGALIGGAGALTYSAMTGDETPKGNEVKKIGFTYHSGKNNGIV